MMFREIIKKSKFILTEGSVIERLRRDDSITLNPDVLHAALIYDEKGGGAMAAIFRQYMDIGQRYGVPMLTYTPTWRANKERLTRAGFDQNVNGDGVRFVAGIREEYGGYAKKIFIGGMIGCRGDAYKPEETLTREEAVKFHRFQLDRLDAAGVDFLIAQTLPALPEAVGIATAMSIYGIPFVISFIVNNAGQLLDKTPLEKAIKLIDGEIYSSLS